MITQIKTTVDGIDSINIEFVGKDNEDYHRDGALLSSTQKNVLQNTYATSSSAVNVSADKYTTVVTAQNNQKSTSPNSSSSVPDKSTMINAISVDGANSVIDIRGQNNTSLMSVGNSTVVAYNDTSQYDSKKLVGIDPVLGDIVIGANELVILRGGWSNRNDVFFSEDPKTTTGFSTINIIWKGVTSRK